MIAHMIAYALLSSRSTPAALGARSVSPDVTSAIPAGWYLAAGVWR